tara:strand:- start:272 stop:535 length:264 start_codon:yes stop_codon:yes gene_type:complete
MRITRKQLRKIISEELERNAILGKLFDLVYNQGLTQRQALDALTDEERAVLTTTEPVPERPIGRQTRSPEEEDMHFQLHGRSDPTEY